MLTQWDSAPSLSSFSDCCDAPSESSFGIHLHTPLSGISGDVIQFLNECICFLLFLKRSRFLKVQAQMSSEQLAP